MPGRNLLAAPSPLARADADADLDIEFPVSEELDSRALLAVSSFIHDDAADIDAPLFDVDVMVFVRARIAVRNRIGVLPDAGSLGVLIEVVPGRILRRDGERGRGARQRIGPQRPRARDHGESLPVRRPRRRRRRRRGQCSHRAVRKLHFDRRCDRNVHLLAKRQGDRPLRERVDAGVLRDLGIELAVAVDRCAPVRRIPQVVSRARLD